MCDACGQLKLAPFSNEQGEKKLIDELTNKALYANPKEVEEIFALAVWAAKGLRKDREFKRAKAFLDLARKAQSILDMSEMITTGVY